MNSSKDALKDTASNFLKTISTIYTSSVHNRIARQMNMLHSPRVRTDLAINSFYYNGSVIFNRLNF